MAVLCNEVEEALALLVKSLGVWPDAGVFTGQAADPKALNCVICEADGDSAEEEPKGTGNFWINARLRVKGFALKKGEAEPKPQHVANVDAVFSGLMVDNLAELLNAQGRTLTVFPTGYIISSPQRGTDENRVWWDELPIRLYCCASILAP